MKAWHIFSRDNKGGAGAPSAPTCNVCGGEAVAVASSSLGPVSWAFCNPCLTKPAEPGCMFEYTYETCGDDVADWVRNMWTWQNGRYVSWDEYAQAMSAGTAKTAQPVEGEARQRGPKDAPTI